MDSVLDFLMRKDVYFGTFVLIIVPILLTVIFKKLIEVRQQVNNMKAKPMKESASNASISSALADNHTYIQNSLGQNSDLVQRSFNITLNNQRSTIIYIDGFISKTTLSEFILEPLMSKEHQEQKINKKNQNVMEYIGNQIVTVNDVQKLDNWDKIIHHLLSGFAILFVDGQKEALCFDIRQIKTRSIDEPVTEVLVRGPKLGFLESLGDNTVILRSLTSDPNFTITEREIGIRTKRKLAVVYIKDIVNPKLIKEVENRLNKIQLDHVPESGYIEQLIEDNYLSIFPQIQSTERPDRVMAALLEGRVGIILDGTPFALIMPVSFSMLLQSPEDYYERWIPMSLIRLLRFMAAFITVFLPSFYIAFISYHQGMIPTDLALTIANARAGVPFPTIIEALIMEISIEMLIEAGLRLPRPVGQTVGLVGAIIIGESAVQAGLVSPIMVIVVAVTAIASFVTPQYSLGMSLRVVRVIAMFAATTLGLYGVTLFFLIILIHLCKLKSFGLPYITPSSLYSTSDLKDFVFRLPLFTMRKRPKEFFTKNPIREKQKRQ